MEAGTPSISSQSMILPSTGVAYISRSWWWWWGGGGERWYDDNDDECDDYQSTGLPSTGVTQAIQVIVFNSILILTIVSLLFSIYFDIYYTYAIWYSKLTIGATWAHNSGQDYRQDYLEVVNLRQPWTICDCFWKGEVCPGRDGGGQPITQRAPWAQYGQMFPAKAAKISTICKNLNHTFALQAGLVSATINFRQNSLKSEIA